MHFGSSGSHDCCHKEEDREETHCRLKFVGGLIFWLVRMGKAETLSFETGQKDIPTGRLSLSLYLGLKACHEAGTSRVLLEVNAYYGRRHNALCLVP